MAATNNLLKDGKAILEEINKIESKKSVSSHLAPVTKLKEEQQKYIKEHDSAESKPDDYSQVKKSISHLEAAEKEFSVNTDALYATADAQKIQRTEREWLIKYGRVQAEVDKVSEFCDRVNKAVERRKARKKRAKSDKPKDTYKSELHDSLVKTIVALVPDALKDEDGKPKAIGKSELKDALDKVADKAGKIKGKAVSGFVNAWVSAGKSLECNLLHEHKGKKYHPEKPES